jgi:hypothetical protein
VPLLCSQEGALGLVETAAAVSRGAGGEPLAPLLVDRLLKLLQDMHWRTLSCVNPPLGALNICQEAAREGILCHTSFCALDVYHNVILRILEACGALTRAGAAVA